VLELAAFHIPELQAKFVPQTRGIAPMRILVIAAAVMALAIASAQAQGRRSPNDAGKPADNKPKVDEKAYKAALERIPEPKDKYDPWGGARPSEPAKKPK
jgi:hypothetical protein